MRLIVKFEEASRAGRLAAYFEQEDIACVVERDEEGYAVWIYDEDSLDRAVALKEKFLHPEFSEAIKPRSEPVKVDAVDPMPISDDPVFLAQMKEFKKRMTARGLYRSYHSEISRGIIIVCSLLLMLNVFFLVRQYEDQAPVVKPTPLMELMLFDQPFIPNIAGYDRVFCGYYTALEEPQYAPLVTLPKFQKIRQGQLWRLFTPALLHGGIFHLLFNMAWVWVLGKQIEERLKKKRYLLLIALLAGATNGVQYLMTGANFMGFSGVVCGFAGFIWMRQRLTPWEGYPIPKNTLHFLFIFIFGVALVQVASFFLNLFGIMDASIHIANAAHLSGLFLGALLGKSRVFDRQKNDRP